MSVAIRQALGAIMPRLEGYVTSGTALVNDDTLTVADIVKLATISEQIIRCNTSLQTQIDRWTQLMLHLTGTDRDDEEKKFEDFKVRNITPGVLMDAAMDIQTKLDLKMDLLRGSRPGGGGTAAPGPGATASPTQIQLPQLQLPEFDGNSGNWPSFWESFSQAIDKNPSLSNSNKLTYLFGKLKGAAKSAVEGFSITNDNYQIVIDTLIARYGDDDKRKNDLQGELFRLPKATKNPKSLRELSEGVERICRQLQGLNVNTDDNPFLATAIKEKIPPEIKTYLVDKEIESGSTWTPKQWRDGLARAVKVQEAASQGERETPAPSAKPSSSSTGSSGPPFRRTFPVVQTTPNANRNNWKGGTPFRGRDQQKNCSLCGRVDHPPSKCPVYPTAEKRKMRFREQNRCLVCGQTAHFAANCPSKRGCTSCGQRHHFLICPRQDSGPTQPANNYRTFNPGNNGQRRSRSLARSNFIQPRSLAIVDPNQSNNQVSTGAHPVTGQTKRAPTYLMVLEISVFCPKEPTRPIKVPVFLDPGSQTSFVTSALIQEVGPRKVGSEELVVSGFVGNNEEASVRRFSSPWYSMMLERADGSWEQIVLNKTDKITPSLNYLSEEAEKFSAVPSDYFPEAKGEPQILIGIKEFWKYVLHREEIRPGLFRVQTIFGPILCGELPISSIDTNSYVMPVIKRDSPEEMVSNLWKLETIGVMDKPEENDDERAVKLFNESICKDSSGRYQVKWPWRSAHPELPDNFSLAFSRLSALSHKLRNSPELREKYQAIIDEQFSLGIIEKAIKTGKRGAEHYLAHHPVITTKVRIVFDASAHVKQQPSLNECLLPGPNLVPDLAGILIRFRETKVPVLADVEKAFLMIGLEEPEREFAKFLWLKDPSKPLHPNNLEIFRFCRVAFGVISSPFILAATIRHHLKQVGGEFAGEMSANLYVDNLLILSNDAQEARKKALEAKQIFAGAKMRLREFISVDPAALTNFPEEDLLSQDEPKVLGLKWVIKGDALKFQFPPPEIEKPLTRRSVLSTIASFFDPLGLFSPCILKAKVFFQTLWETGKKWDDSLMESRLGEWQSILAQWPAEEILIPRLTASGAGSQLHIFTDASPEAYAVTVYLRVHGPNGVQTSLVFAKSRLRPRKLSTADGLTIPKLELLGVLIGTRCKEFVKENLVNKPARVFVWTDSQIVLAWLSSIAPQPVFIANRLHEIRKHRDVQFGYVRSEFNPADLGTKGCAALELKKNPLWWDGPHWLTQSEEKWPVEYRSVVLPPEESPEPDLSISMPATQEKAKSQFPIKAEDYSSWNIFLFHAWVYLRFLAWTMRKGTRFQQKFPDLANLSPKLPWVQMDRETTRKYIIKAEQKAYRLDEFPGSHCGQDGLIRLSTRLLNADQPVDFKFPIILPRDSHITYLLIMDSHTCQCHSGIEATLCEFLTQYWCTRARRLVKSILSKCPICIRDRAIKFSLPNMPPLPASRVQPSSPFQSVGLDYLGPTAFKAKDGIHKAWVLLFTCLACRAVHLEVVDNMETNGFLLCFRRFVARRGTPAEILSDHGTQLVLAKQVLDSNPDYGIKWKMIPQLSPWAGGVYERIVALIKTAFRRALGRKILGWSQLVTFTSEVEAILNARPITYVSEEPTGPMALRPIDFLRPQANVILSEPTEEEEIYKPSPAEKLGQMWAHSNRSLRSFWDQWSREYLLFLRQRTQIQHKKPRSSLNVFPQIGQIVMVEDEGFPRNDWPIGRIIGLDNTPNRAKSAQILMPNKRTWSRPINKLVLLEIPPNIEAEEEPSIPVAIPDKPSKIKVNGKNVRWAPFNPTLIHSVTVILGLILFSGISASPLTCNIKGIMVKLPEDKYNADVCCEGTCGSRAGSHTPFLIPLPVEILITGFTCLGKFWAPPQNLTEYELECPAVDGCLLIECTVCWEQLLNPQCYPLVSSALIGGLLCIILGIMAFGCCLLSCCRKGVKNGMWLMKIIRCFWPTARFRRRAYPRNDPEELYEEFIPHMPSYTKPKNKPNKFKPLTRLGYALSIVLCLNYLINTANAGMEIISMTADTEHCWNTMNGTECHFNSVTTFTLLPAGQAVDMVIRGPKAEPLGVFSFTLQELTLECGLESLGWLRSYKVETFASKRCPTAGSCKKDKCTQLKINETVPELAEVQKYPGNNFCADSTAFWFNDCGLPGDSCLFYRNHIVPLSKYQYELATCPTWEFQFKVGLQLEFPGHEPIKETVDMFPGRTFHWKAGNLSLTPSPLGQPPVPLLSGKFVMNWTHGALVPDFPLDLHCNGEYEAQFLECQLAVDACSSCRIDHSNGLMRCHCRELDLEHLITDPSHALPLNVGQIQLRYLKDRIWAETPYTPVQIYAKAENLRLVIQQDRTTCSITPETLLGCYRCKTGGRLTYTCHSEFGEALANVQCLDGTSWVAQCSQNGTTSKATLSWNNAEVDTKCKVECPGGSSEFPLNGTLMFVAPSRNRFIREAGARSWERPGEHWKEGAGRLGQDALYIFLSLLGFPQCFIVVGIVLGAIIVVILFIKYNPIFRTYRALARMTVVIFCLSHLPFASAHIHLTPDPLPYFLIGIALLLFAIAGAILKSENWHKKWRKGHIVFPR